MMILLHAIDAYLERTGMSATRLGREAANDPGLVHGLRRGRQPRAAMRAKLFRFLRGGVEQ